MQLGNMLAAQQQISLEARKSFALPLYFKVRGTHPEARSVDLTGCSVTFVAVTDEFAGGNIVINKPLDMVDVTDGQAQLNLQAAELDLPEGDYPYMVSLITADGYSAAVLKGYLHVLNNASPFKANTFETAVSQSITLTLQQNNRVTVEIAAVDAGELTIGTVTTLSSVEDATAEIVGNWPNQQLNLGIPRGEGAGDLQVEVDARIAGDNALAADIADIIATYATQAALALVDAAAKNASNLSSGTVAEPRISSAIARVTAMQAADNALQAAINAHLADTSDAHDAAAISFQSSGLVPANDVQEAIETVAAAAMPSGTVLPYGGDTAPAGYLMADGSAVSRTTYASLFAVYGTKYGIGDGFTTFNLPNLKGKAIVGLDASQTEFTPLGKTGGAKTHQLSVAELALHQHDINHDHGSVNTDTEPAHTHNFTLIKSTTDSHDHSGDDGGSNYSFAAQGPDTGGSAGNVSATAGAGSHAHAVNLPALGAYNSGAAGSNTPHNNLQPYITLNYIIKV